MISIKTLTLPTMGPVRVCLAQSLMGDWGKTVLIYTTAKKDQSRYLASCFGLTAQLHEVGGQAAVWSWNQTRGSETWTPPPGIQRYGSWEDLPPVGGGTLSRLITAAVVSVFCRQEEKKSPVSLDNRGKDGWLVKPLVKSPTLDEGFWTTVK